MLYQCALLVAAVAVRVRAPREAHRGSVRPEKLERPEELPGQEWTCVKGDTL